MSILIKGMEMPKNCDACSFACWSNLHQTGSCYLLDSKQCFDDYSTDYRTKRSEHCPLIEVPEPHGRLIDADEMFDEFVTEGQRSKRYKLGEKWELNGEEIRSVISRLPTVIPANEEG